ncbi:MAG: phytoene/squalene synthase family protein [Bacteroidia bacterium]|nr:phytoene/squalene synthase family protein [Bacteroidia bacterium]
MKELFDNVSASASRITTKTYSTSFSLGIYCLNKRFHRAIYNIYGFVRFADEIVDSFHDYDKAMLLKEFREETYKAIERKISLNPILNSFQEVVNAYNIERELVDCFLDSMEMDLHQDFHDTQSYNKYILGSAEVVGLMCLRVFTEGNENHYQELKPAAMKLGSAFQKVNFLRDLKNDYESLGRTYFPQLNMKNFSAADKQLVEKEIEMEFEEALAGIKTLPSSSRFGVYVAYVYYKSLFNKIKAVPPGRILMERVRVPNSEKFSLLLSSYFKHTLRMI